MKNVGDADRIIRFLLAIVIAALGVYFHSWWGLLALVPLGTALMRVCPVYLPFKLSTIRK